MNEKRLSGKINIVAVFDQRPLCCRKSAIVVSPDAPEVSSVTFGLPQPE